AALPQGLAGATAFSGLTLDARMDAGELDATAGATFEGATLSLRASGAPLAATPRYALHVELPRLPVRLPGVPAWEALAGRVHASLELNLNGTGYAPANVELGLRANGDAGAVTANGTASFDRALAWTLTSLAFAHLDIARIAGAGGSSALNG